MKYKCLSIAGFDGSGGAGIQADIKTFSALGCYAMSVLTALPVQNTCGVRNCYDIPLMAIEEQLETIFDDIVPDSIKIGMLFSSAIIEIIADFLRCKNISIPIVLDPVMVAKSGDSLLLPDAVEALKSKLIPLCTVITPNIPEAAALVGNADMGALAEQLLNLGPQAVLLKGGHNSGQYSNDLLLERGQEPKWLLAPRINSLNTHGTGCTLSAAVCAYLAQGIGVSDACERAKHYLHGAIAAAKDDSLGKGYGPVHHFYQIWPC
ncbi:MAG: bifunctional hydroxymethylpyrimidine kinase/phosphomethylpyrimidine kinase [Proteobacteria bacterium]|nr:bifunctional hydroxymethylpyrimidine kinase/phosphomethylpyrimidine kinase [Pseudomonadota bacterium]